MVRSASHAEHVGSIPSPARILIARLPPESFEKRMKRYRGGVTVRHCLVRNPHGSAAEHCSVGGPAQVAVAGGEVAQADGGAPPSTPPSKASMSPGSSTLSRTSNQPSWRCSQAVAHASACSSGSTTVAGASRCARQRARRSRWPGCPRPPTTHRCTDPGRHGRDGAPPRSYRRHRARRRSAVMGTSRDGSLTECGGTVGRAGHR